MSDDLDLGAVHQRHEPDPEFRAGLRQRIAQIVSDDRPVGVDSDGSLVEVVHVEPAPRRATRRVTGSVLLIATAAAAIVTVIAVRTLASDKSTPAVGTVPPSGSTIPAMTVAPPESTSPPSTSGVAEPSVFQGVSGWIAFRRGDDLVAVDPDDPANQISFGASLGADPIGWSANGTQLLVRPQPELTPLFIDGGWAIGTTNVAYPLDAFVLSSDGSRTRLTNLAGIDRGANWASFSPDGTEVVYACCGGSDGPYIVGADGGEPRLLGQPRPGGEPFPEWAAWSPDGTRIAFVDFWEDHPTYGDHTYTLSFLDPDTGEVLGAEVNMAAAGPVWSPDGTQLAFWAVVPDPDADPANATLGPNGDFPAQIFVINADGSGLRQLTSTGDNRWPTWSPDGSRIAFAQGQLSLMTAPDGSQAAFVEAGTRHLVTMASDGTDVQRVEGVNLEGAIAWNPLPLPGSPTTTVATVTTP